MILNLGVIEVPYVEFEVSARQKAKKPPSAARAGVPPRRREPVRTRSANRGTTTGDVAKILEEKYHIMQVFFDENTQVIVEYLEDSVAGALESLLLGAPAVTFGPFGEGTRRIEKRFRDFIIRQEIEDLGIPGVPTAAALAGVNHRLKIKRGHRRPSFVDTGLYVQSFRAWLT